VPSKYLPVCLLHLGHYATSRKAAGARPDEVKKFFQIYLILAGALGPRVYSAPKRNECDRNKNVE
jgi:hypothetical protein